MRPSVQRELDVLRIGVCAELRLRTDNRFKVFGLRRRAHLELKAAEDEGVG